MDPAKINNKDLLVHFEKAVKSDATDILMIYNRREQYDFIHKYIDIKKNPRFLEIIPKQSWKLTRTCTDPKELVYASAQMGALVKKQFGYKKGIKLYFSKSKNLL